LFGKNIKLQKFQLSLYFSENVQKLVKLEMMMIWTKIKYFSHDGGLDILENDILQRNE